MGRLAALRASASERARRKAAARARARARARAKELAKARAKAKAKADAQACAVPKKAAAKKEAAVGKKTKPKTARERAATKTKASASAAKPKAKPKTTAKGKTKAKAKTTPTKGGRKAVKGKGCTPPKPGAKAPTLTPFGFTPAPAGAGALALPGLAGPAPAYPGAPTPAGVGFPQAPAAAPGPPPVVFDRAAAERLLWRAGFGPRPGDVDRLVAMGLTAAVKSLVYPSGLATLSGPAPRTSAGALAPNDLWGHDHLWWMDRMIRSDQPLVERMTLIWHDWFATSIAGVGQPRLLLDQNATLRAGALGGFQDLLLAVTRDPAMLVWLNGVGSDKRGPNENYAREVMELFTLGAGRGAYSETDVRELARAFTGWTAQWVRGPGWGNFQIRPEEHDAGEKTIFGSKGRFGEADAVRLLVEHPLHASFFVRKLWSAFIPTLPDATTQGLLEALYVSSGRRIAPVVEQILLHPDFYRGPTLVKPPVVHAVGLLRAIGRGIDTDVWTWVCEQAGQRLFQPPSIAGWDEARWLDTATWRGRWLVAQQALQPTQADAWSKSTPYSTSESAATAVAKALGSLGSPVVSGPLGDALNAFAATALPGSTPSWAAGPYRAMRYSALRMMIATAPDWQVS